MIGNQRILAVCPARGGSKGIPLKNLVPFLGVPLVAVVGRLVSEIPMIDRAVVSTDHAEIARVARESGLDAPFMRPEEISGDQISDAQVLLHALEEMERIDGVVYDLVIMLQRPERAFVVGKPLTRGQLDEAVDREVVSFDPHQRVAAQRRDRFVELEGVAYDRGELVREVRSPGSEQVEGNLVRRQKRGELQQLRGARRLAVDLAEGELPGRAQRA